MQKWEYKILQANLIGEGWKVTYENDQKLKEDIKEIYPYIRELGNMGWELVSDQTYIYDQTVETFFMPVDTALRAERDGKRIPADTYLEEDFPSYSIVGNIPFQRMGTTEKNFLVCSSQKDVRVRKLSFKRPIMA